MLRAHISIGSEMRNSIPCCQNVRKAGSAHCAAPPSSCFTSSHTRSTTKARSSPCSASSAIPPPTPTCNADNGSGSPRQAHIHPTLSTLKQSAILVLNDFASFNRNRLRQIARLIHIATTAPRDVIGQQLQRQNFQKRHQQPRRRRQLDQMIRRSPRQVIARR